MRIMSDTVITRDDLTAVDAKQTRQIMGLRIALGVSFVLNVLFTVGMKFLG